MSSPAYRAVQRGIKLLDEFVPNWERRVDPSVLAMSDRQQCMLGQTFSDFGVGCRKLVEEAMHKRGLGVKLDPSTQPEIYSEYYGFNKDRNITFQELDTCWLNAIAKRRAAKRAAKSKGR